TNRIDDLISGEVKAPEVAAAKKQIDLENAKYLVFLVAFFLLAIAHAQHPFLGGVVGAASFAGAAWLIELSVPAIIALAIVGGILGLILRWLLDFPPWCGDTASAIAGHGGDALAAGAEAVGGL